MASNMRSLPGVCVDVVAPPPSRRERLALLKDAEWSRGDVLQIGFLDGDSELLDRVKKVACQWLEFATSLDFIFDAPEPEIRISFKSDPGKSWSQVGTQCRRVPPPVPTMNFGWLEPDSDQTELEAVVLHEFGHALGCIHEHQNPSGRFEWDVEAVYNYYADRGWDRSMVDDFVLSVYDREVTNHTQVDTESIMLYPIPPGLTTNGLTVGFNSRLSETDKTFIGERYG